MLLERASTRSSKISPRPTDCEDSLSGAESRLWFVDQIAKDDPFYNMPLAARLHGPLDQKSLDSAVAQMVQRHESLRTTYHLVDGEPQRRIHHSQPIRCTWVDVSNSRDPDNEIRRKMRVASRTPFDLENGPLLRITVYRISDTEHVILLVMHHIISDGWSMIVMLRELTLAYEMNRSQDSSSELSLGSLPSLPIQYADFAHWQNEQMSEERIEKQMAYWRESLAGAPAVLDLPTDRPRPAVQDFIGATVDLELPVELTQSVNQLASKLQTTPFAVLMAAEALLLGRFSRQDDLVLGTASAGRVHPEIEPLIGFFVNTLALRVRLEDDLSFVDLIKQVHQTTVAAHEHADVPFERLVEELAPTRDRSFSPIFQSALVMQNLPRDISEKGSIQVDPILVDNGTAKYDLTFFLWEESEKLVGHVEYRSTLFDRDTIERLIDSYRTLLSAAVAQPDSSIDRLTILSEKQRSQVIDEFNQTTVTNPPPYLLQELVEENAQRTPEKTAVVHGNTEVSYRDLIKKANNIAGHLIAAGVVSETAVVIKLPRSIDLIASILGILKAGGSFVPVDPEFPSARVDQIVNDTSAKVLIDPNWIREHNEAPPNTALPTIDPSQRAYVIFTSGSTGVAKGVEIEHRGIVNFVRAQIDRMQVSSDDRFSFSFSPCFDGAISEIFYALGSGGTSVVVDKPTLLVPEELSQLLNQNNVSVGKFPPALLSTLDPARLPNLRIVASAGDKLTGELARRWLTKGRRFFNGYGPTEVSVGCSMMPLDETWTGEKPPIGPPMNNMRMYILDEHQNPLPIGASGEIYIGGKSVGRGYLGMPEQTDAVFLHDPFVSDDADSDDRPPRMYRTGDLGRWLACGNVEFVGRVDDQVSLRGFRIEPGEIAATLETLEGVRQAAVIERNENETSQLVAYVVTQKDRGEEERTSHLESNHVTQWRDLFEQTHRIAPPVLDPSFNITGWISTYTGKPIPSDEMRQWTEGAVRRILSLRPRNVLEIGCGTGLLLLRIAEHCKRYVGSDLLASSLQNIESELAHRPHLQDKVALVQAFADEFNHLGDDKFDCVVLNSVVQYFPGIDYLLRVVEGAIAHLAPGGSLFIGDVRNLRLQTAMATSVEMSNADPQLSLSELKHRVASRIEHEEELLLDPELFSYLKTIHPRISNVRVLLKDTAHQNELGRFRYDVIIDVDEHQSETTYQTIPFNEESDLSTAPPSSVRYTGINNSRVAKDCHSVALLETMSDTATVADLMDHLEADASHFEGREPNDLIELSPTDSSATWNEDDPSRFDVVVCSSQADTNSGDTRTVEEPNVASPSVPSPTDTNGIDPSQFANDPIGTERDREFTKRLRDELSARLPAYMIPSAFVVLEEIPRTINGKIDRANLPRPAGRPAWAGNFKAPTTATQEALVKIWEDLLDTRPIGIEDDFFELGGHSMLAVRMTSDIERLLGKRLPLVALFQNATIAHLAERIDAGELSEAGSTLVPLKMADATGSTEEVEPPLFCIHPAGGTVFCYMEMTSHLRSGRAVYGVQANGIDGTQPPHETLAEMAAHYARAIREIHPEGTVHLAGWSLGGNIAFEVARQLQSRGTPVGVVALLDSGLLSPETQLREEDFLPLLSALFPGAMNLDLEQIRQKSPAEQLQFFVDRASQAGIVPGELNDIVATKDTANAAHVFNVFQSNVKAVHEYVAEPFDGNVHLFRPVDQGKTNSLFDDPVLGWREVTEDVHLHEVPGDHAHMLQSPAAETIASQLDQLMLKRSAVPV
ncbi:amino acid adenylation domain-containing protein [Rhodopirellula sallentina SM41]|uniref:Amino acid adenylation domain-containing protein n=2 Tax=Rhodopirellula TaxID=265488 RepID=M5UQP3_9BACT|nr:amino acid adenylation domain-containing protein [Rhodopirellula sallentina SM41]